MIHLYNIMDNKKLPEKLLKQEQDHLKQSYFMAYDEISNFCILSKFFIFHFFCGESENKKINKNYAIFVYRFIIMNILI